MYKKKLIIASRKSPLALVQTSLIKDHLQRLYPELLIDILPLSTEGDRHLGQPLAAMGGKSLFVKELEQAILSGKADIAVHSSKDMPVELPDGLNIACFYRRHDSRDAFVSNRFTTLEDLPENAVIGTSSLRRQCLLRHFKPGVRVAVLRGNIQTRLGRLDQNEFDAIVLAAAGLERMNLMDRAKSFFNPAEFVPAVTQGILCIEARIDDRETLKLLKPLHHEETAACATAERAVNHYLQGGCQVPIAAHAIINHGMLLIQGLVGEPDGSKILRADATGPMDNAGQLGKMVAGSLMDQGARAILQKVYNQNG